MNALLKIKFCTLRALPVLALLPITACLLTACTESKKPATQVVAKVNNDEISIHQVNNALAQIPNVPVDSREKVKKDILARLVNQELAVQQAENMKIDRSPEVMMLVDQAKREILTRAYLARVVAGLPKPTDDQIKKFYDDHPQLFTQRRIYKMQEIAVSPAAVSTADLKTSANGKSMEDVRAWLRKRDIAFTERFGDRPAEQVPLSILPELASMKDGQTGVFETPQALLILHLESSRLVPIDEKTAMQRIPQYLMNEQAKQAINTDLERLKAQAKIEYLGEFAQASATPNQPAPVVAQAEKPQVAQPEKPRAANTSKAANDSQTADASSIEKGLAGLK